MPDLNSTKHFESCVLVAPRPLSFVDMFPLRTTNQPTNQKSSKFFKSPAVLFLHPWFLPICPDVFIPINNTGRLSSYN
jgi:hypothetical protein